jgi:poly-gamma-glutamate capsule biosynthesis protein CapA/YwtB (metallophosphatase superfamily)
MRIWRFVFLLLLWRCASAEEAGFPFHFTPESHVPSYLLTRLEGLSRSQVALHMVGYGRKWRSKKFTAPPEEIRYFDAQRALSRYMGSETIPAGVRLGLVGDIMWLPSQNNRFVTPEVLEHLHGFDAVLGNLESPVIPGRRVSSPIFSPARFNADPDLIRSFRSPDGRNLFTALSVANNHVLDQGDAGALATLKFLDDEGIAHSGAGPKGAPRFCTFTRGGIKFGFYATTWGVNDPGLLSSTSLSIALVPGLAPERPPADISEIERVLAEMTQSGCDFKIVSMHWGFEFEYYPSPAIVQLGRRIAAAGADLIVGAHPHVQQPAETCFVNGYEKKYSGGPVGRTLAALSPAGGSIIQTVDGRPRKTLILYSLGNFVTAMFTTLARVGYIAGVDVYRTTGGQVDWRSTGGTFVYNQQPPLIGSTPRRLFLLKGPPYPNPDLDKPCEARQKPLDFLKNHLGL